MCLGLTSKLPELYTSQSSEVIALTDWEVLSARERCVLAPPTNAIGADGEPNSMVGAEVETELVSDNKETTGSRLSLVYSGKTYDVGSGCGDKLVAGDGSLMFVFLPAGIYCSCTWTISFVDIPFSCNNSKN